MKLPTLAINQLTAVRIAYYTLFLVFVANICVFVALFRFDQSLKKQSTDINHHIDCIINIFQVPNHTSFYLADPKTCHLVPISPPVVKSSTPALSVTSPPKVTLAPAPTPQSQPQLQVSPSSSPPVLPSSLPAPSPGTLSITPPSLINQVINFLGL